MKFLATGLLVVSLSACVTSKGAEAVADPFDTVGAFMKQEVITETVPNAIGLVSVGDAIVFEQAHGRITDKTEASINTIVRLDSLTKPITAAAVLVLIDEGLINLSDPVSKYLPTFKNARVGADRKSPDKPITIQNLLTHTGGLAGYSDEVNKLWDANSNKEFANGIAALPLRHNPGDGFQYGNAYEVLPAVIAVVSGMKFEEFVSAKILQPLDMEDTSFVVPDSKRERYSSLYTREGEKLTVMSTPFDPETEKFASGGGGLKSTVRDYHKFATMLLNKGQFEGKQILSSDAVEAMTKVQVAKDIEGAWQGARGWGYGLAVKHRAEDGNRASVGAFGWNGGFGTQFFVDPEKKLIGVIVTQIHFSNPHELREGFEKLTYQVIGD
ncbi:MAG: serine hydrolase domain-containing protein [Parasphingorhabdus sp.]